MNASVVQWDWCDEQQATSKSLASRKDSSTILAGSLQSGSLKGNVE
jgi:hypothetical protein